MPHMYYKMCRNENGNSRYTSYRGEIGIREIQCNDGMKGTYLAACDCNNGLMNKIKSYACTAYRVIGYTAKPVAM